MSTFAPSPGALVTEVLVSFLQRARGTPGQETVTVLWSDQATSPGLTGRRKSGIRGVQDLPAWAVNELEQGVPLKFCGTSGFACPRVVRHVLRHGLSMRDLDAVNMVFSTIPGIVRKLGIVGQFEDIDYYCSRRADALEMLQRDLDIT